MSTRLHGRLTALQVKHAAKRGLYPDGNGLALQVSRNGSRSWIYRYRFGGRRRYLGLGSTRDVTLAEARERMVAARRLLDAGEDPIEIKRGRRAATLLAAARSMTFASCAQAFIEANRARWTPRHANQVITSLDTYANPVLGSLPVAEVDTAVVMKVLQPIWNEKPETSNRVRARIEAVLDWAKARGFREGENPAARKGHIDHLLPAKSKIVQHHKALPYDEIGAFMVQLRAFPAIDARALEFTILTTVRTSEAREARWEEIDMGAKVWTVPAIRMKARREFRVPLSGAAMELLRALPGSHNGGDFLFPGRKPGQPINRTRLLEFLPRINADVTIHGFRSCFRDWAGDRTEFARDVIEAALGHAISDKTEAAYRRGDALEKRRLLMEQWSRFCAGEASGAEVIELRRA
jgi:integrase